MFERKVGLNKYIKLHKEIIKMAMISCPEIFRRSHYAMQPIDSKTVVFLLKQAWVLRFRRGRRGDDGVYTGG